MDDSPCQPESRAAPRHEVEVPVRCSAGAGVTRDMSASGLFFMAGGSFEEGQQVQLELTFDYADPTSPLDVRCWGRVCRVERAESGIEDGAPLGVAICLEAFSFGDKGSETAGGPHQKAP